MRRNLSGPRAGVVKSCAGSELEPIAHAEGRENVPRMGGIEALGHMRRLRPELPAILLSGYTDADIGTALEAGPTLFLGKPFLGDALLAGLQKLLRPG